jgi:protein MAK16
VHILILLCFRTDKSTFCRNENNVTGQCNRQSCPLANSQYATVREIDGVFYLYKKTVERAHSPAKLWEKIKLDNNFEKAIGQIEGELEHWPAFLQAKCKLRLAKSLEYLKRMRKIALDEANAPILKVKAKKVLKREASREARAKKVAQLENVIERELLERLQKGVYGDIYNLPQRVFESVLERHGQAQKLDEEAIDEEVEDELEYVEDDEEEEEYEEEEEEEGEMEREYLSDAELTDAEDDVQDLEDLVRPPVLRKKRGAHVEIEYETEAASLPKLQRK